MELRTSHQHPGFPHHRVIFTTVEPFDVACSLSAALRPFRPFVDAVQFDGFLALFYGFVEIALAHFSALLVAHRVEGDDFSVIVLVAFLLFQ